MNWTHNYNYYIEFNINNTQYSNDKKITELLNIEYEEYKNFLLKNNAFYDYEYGLIFKSQEYCSDCIKKLKEKYNDRLIMIKLTEDQIHENIL
jgi:hypothetical protein